jgi:hypothetical protein
VSTSPSWVERTLAEFPRATETRTHKLLLSLAVNARETHLDDPQTAYNLYVEQILQQDGVDAELIDDAYRVAWDAALTKPIFLALDLEGRTTLDVTSDATLDTTLDATRTPVVRESVVVPRRARRVYDALLAHCRHHGLPYHCVGITLRSLATQLGYSIIEPRTGTPVPDHSRAGNDIKAAIEANILVALHRGRAGEHGLSAIYGLRGTGESLESVLLHGHQQREYLKRQALLNNSAPIDTARSRVFVHGEIEPAAVTAPIIIERMIDANVTTKCLTRSDNDTPWQDHKPTGKWTVGERMNFQKPFYEMFADQPGFTGSYEETRRHPHNLRWLNILIGEHLDEHGVGQESAAALYEKVKPFAKTLVGADR